MRYIFEIARSAGPIPETIKGDQDSYRYKIRYRSQESAFGHLVKKNANLGRSIRRNGRLVGTRTPDLYRVKVNATY
jgi:hypothetical protein